jgi:hypothetical protein
MSQAIRKRKPSVSVPVWPVHGLQKEVSEQQRTVPVRFRPFLRVDEFEFITRVHDQLGPCLRTDADPVHALWNPKGSIRLYRNFEFVFMQGINECLIQLQQWFATRADDKTAAIRSIRPPLRDRVSHCLCASEFLPARPVNTNEIGIAELADRAGSIFFPSRPQIATSEPTKHGWPPSLRALPLKRIEDLLHRVAHADNRRGSLIPSGSGNPFSSNPFNRSVHESQHPQGNPSAEGS